MGKYSPDGFDNMFANKSCFRFASLNNPFSAIINGQLYASLKDKKGLVFSQFSKVKTNKWKKVAHISNDGCLSVTLRQTFCSRCWHKSVWNRYNTQDLRGPIFKKKPGIWPFLCVNLCWIRYNKKKSFSLLDLTF